MKHLNELAKKIAEIYRKNEKVNAVMLAGSVSRGLCDEFSDIELYVLWEAAPTDEDRKDVIFQLDGKILSFYDVEDEEWSEAYSVNGVKIEVSNFLSSTIDRFSEDVTVKMDTNLDKQVIVASIHDGIPLHGAENIFVFKQRVQTYPDQLKVNMIEEQLFFSSRWAAREAFIHRGDFFIFQKVASDVIEKILLMLHGLNGIYVVHPAFKWLSYTVSKLEQKPRDLEKRILSIFNSQSEVSVRELEKLLEETVDLIEKFMPSVNTNEFRKHIKGSRA